jgi:CRP-like cAMP-binding protein
MNDARRPMPLTLVRNALLGSLPPEVVDEVRRRGQLAFLARRQVLFAAHTWHDAYFPLVGLIALQHLSSDGNAMTVEVISHEGMAGLWLHLDAMPSPYVGTALSDLVAWRLPQNALGAVAGAGPLGELLTRYAQVQLEERATLMHCGRSHPLVARVARFLADAAMRAQTQALHLTHEDVAQAVGAHRPAVTEALQQLTKEGAVRVGRALVTVTDAGALGASSCECGAALVELYQRLHHTR